MEKIVLSAKELMEQERDYEPHNEFIDQEDFDSFVLFAMKRKGSPSFRDSLFGFVSPSRESIPIGVLIAHNKGEKVNLTVNDLF